MVAGDTEHANAGTNPEIRYSRDVLGVGKGGATEASIREMQLLKVEVLRGKNENTRYVCQKNAKKEAAKLFEAGGEGGGDLFNPSVAVKLKIEGRKFTNKH